MNAELLAQASDGFLSFLLYLVIAVIWVAGKFMQQREARRKVEDLKRRREEREREAQRTGRPPAREASPTVTPPPPPKPRSLEDDLQDFLGRMAGLTKEEAPPPPPPPPPPKKRPVLQFDQAPLPPPVPSKQTLANKRAASIQDSADIEAMESYAKIQDIEDIAELELDPDKASFGGPDLLMNVRAMMIDMSRASVRIPTVRIPTMRTVHTKTAKPDLGDTDDLKHAIVSGILLNPPKALTPDPFHQDPGQL
ncbi:MAG: hypothetical protein JJU05_06470 [Verrucomicrobia bacterium]|nr:hypothetical protein [Verrucomicrobiota bacterium]MCH8525716.1 hypothetical protein [Kiritimatiellia bacterium]